MGDHRTDVSTCALAVLALGMGCVPIPGADKVEVVDSGSDSPAETGDTAGEVIAACEGTLDGVRSVKYCGSYDDQAVGWCVGTAEHADGQVSARICAEDSEVSGFGAVYEIDLLTSSSAVDLFPAVTSDLTSGTRGFPRTVANSVDVDGDGELDLVAATPFAHSSLSGTSWGRVFVYLGPWVGDRDAEDYDRVFEGSTYSEYIGSFVVDVPDLDGDGDDEILIADDQNSLTKTAKLVLGPFPELGDGEPDAEYVDADYVGLDVTRGDLNGDGSAELLVTDASYGDGGAVMVVANDLRGVVDVGEETAVYAESGSVMGGARGSMTVGDTTGDGYADLTCVVREPRDAGYPGDIWPYVVRVMAGPITADQSVADATFTFSCDNVWTSPVVGGDLDADGLEGDLAVGTCSPRGLYVFPAPLAGSWLPEDVSPVVSESYERASPESSWLAWSVASLPDLDGDGAAELLVGAPADSEGGTYAGAAYLIYGASW